ncbi:MAG: hypothetical protein ACK5NQ_16085 [Pseudomonas sp.]
MEQLKATQQIQLKLVESAAINECCISDLISILPEISGSNHLLELMVALINLLQADADKLKILSRTLTLLP